MKSKLTTMDYLINETNKVEVANDLIHCYEDFLIKIIKRFNEIEVDEIENFLKIIKMREDYLFKKHKIK